MNDALFDPKEHEALAYDAWDAEKARAFIERIVREADGAFERDGGWPLHPEDRYAESDEPNQSLYSGAAGTMWALTRLARTNRLSLRCDYAAAIARCEETYRANPAKTGNVVPSYFLGTVGIMLARHAIAGERDVLDRIAAGMLANAGNPTREALWGSPGTALAGLLLRERDEDDRYDGLLRAVQDELWLTWEPATRDGLLWEQEMYGRKARYVGAGHGAFGNLAPLVRARDLLSPQRAAELFERVPALLEAYVIRDGAAANWWSLGGPPRFGNRMQWCHGAPGVVISLAQYPRNDERVEALLVAAGEGIWRAGPLRKGPNLCHGTAGNGFAMLRLGERTGDDRWLRRARRFAMHAMRQVDAWRAEFGMPAFSLWTGDPGVALYVDAVLRNDPALLSLDTL